MAKALEQFLCSKLSTSVLRPLGHAGGGCISDARSYETDSGPIFVKYNTKSQVKVIFRRGRGSTPAYSQAQLMFEGEAASLEAISKTNTLRVPKPLNVRDVWNTLCVVSQRFGRR